MLKEGKLSMMGPRDFEKKKKGGGGRGELV